MLNASNSASYMDMQTGEVPALIFAGTPSARVLVMKKWCGIDWLVLVWSPFFP